MSGLSEIYKKEIIPTMMKEYSLSNAFEVPAVEKVVVNSGVGGFKDNKDALKCFEEELALLTGQRPSRRKARKSEAGFKIRKGEVVGLSVTLRGKRMWAFLDKLINIVLPRVRDFRGLGVNSFDKGGNYSFGILEHTIFPEVNPNTTKAIRGLQVTIATDTNDVEKSKKLLSLLGMPFGS